MAFWGIEVKAGKPYTHLYDNARGRLRISQAALGNGKSTNQSSLQINVGNRRPIILCNLIPNVMETCHLELEFEEAEEVIFSVLGQRSVHLSGYYIGSSMRKIDGDETDSYGEDIANTDTSGSYNRSDDEDKYESDFIDDDDIEMSPPAQRKVSVVNHEIIEDDKPSNGNAKRRRLKKKHRSDFADSVDGSHGKPVVQHNSSAVLESEDEDCFPISFFSRRRITINDSEDDKTMDEDRKTKIVAISEDSKPTSLPCKEICHPCDTKLSSDIGQENNVKSKKKKKKKKKNQTDEKLLDVRSEVPADKRENVEPDKDKDDKEVGIHKENGVQFGEPNNESKRAAVDGTETDGKQKKKKKKLKKGKICEAAIEGTNEADNNNKMDQDTVVSNEMDKLPHHSEGAVPSVLSAPTQETSGKLKKKSKKRTKDDRGSEAEDGEVGDVNQTGARKKKKEKKKHDKDLSPNQKSIEQGKLEETKAGLKSQMSPIKEDFATSKPNDKKATPLKKV